MALDGLLRKLAIGTLAATAFFSTPQSARAYGNPVNLGSAINTSADETDPSRSGDVLYYGRPDAFGSSTIWRAFWNPATQIWENAEEVPGINNGANVELSPAVTADGQELSYVTWDQSLETANNARLILSDFSNERVMTEVEGLPYGPRVQELDSSFFMDGLGLAALRLCRGEGGCDPQATGVWEGYRADRVLSSEFVLDNSGAPIGMQRRSELDVLVDDDANPVTPAPGQITSVDYSPDGLQALLGIVCPGAAAPECHGVPTSAPDSDLVYLTRLTRDSPFDISTALFLNAPDQPVDLNSNFSEIAGTFFGGLTDRFYFASNSQWRAGHRGGIDLYVVTPECDATVASEVSPSGSPRPLLVTKENGEIRISFDDLYAALPAVCFDDYALHIGPVAELPISPWILTWQEQGAAQPDPTDAQRRMFTFPMAHQAIVPGTTQYFLVTTAFPGGFGTHGSDSNGNPRPPMVFDDTAPRVFREGQNINLFVSQGTLPNDTYNQYSSTYLDGKLFFTSTHEGQPRLYVTDIRDQQTLVSDYRPIDVSKPGDGSTDIGDFSTVDQYLDFSSGGMQLTYTTKSNSASDRRTSIMVGARPTIDSYAELRQLSELEGSTVQEKFPQLFDDGKRLMAIRYCDSGWIDCDASVDNGLFEYARPDNALPTSFDVSNPLQHTIPPDVQITGLHMQEDGLRLYLSAISGATEQVYTVDRPSVASLFDLTARTPFTVQNAADTPVPVNGAGPAKGPFVFAYDADNGGNRDIFISWLQ